MLNESDPCRVFAEERLKLLKDESGNPDKSFTLGFEAVRSSFVEWYSENYKGFKPKTKDAIKSGLSRILGTMVANKWYGVKIIENTGL